MELQHFHLCSNKLGYGEKIGFQTKVVLVVLHVSVWLQYVAVTGTHCDVVRLDRLPREVASIHQVICT